MARDFSAEYARQLRFSKLPSLHVRLGARPVIKAYRLARRRWAPGKVVPVDAGHGELVGPALEASQEHLRSHRWAFLEDVLEPSFHADLLAGWPRRHFLEPASDLRKSWDRGFSWRRGHSEDPEHLAHHPALGRFLDYLRSEELGGRVSAIVGKPLSCYSFLVTSSITGSVVAPHRDDWAFLDDGPEAVFNFVFFVDGSGGPRSGGLSILGDNTFDDVIFESLELRNTALVYDVKAPFYHGFEPVERGKFRRAIICNFVSPDYGS